MSTSTEVDIQSIESLDIRPACKAERHKGERGPAQYYVILHECLGVAVCSECHTSWNAEIDEYFRTYEAVQCPRCHRAFRTKPSFTKSIPL